jgi:hypothetical protein
MAVLADFIAVSTNAAHNHALVPTRAFFKEFL